MTLDVDKEKMTIMGVQFDNRREFRIVWYAVSSNMIEGWQPNQADIKQLRERAMDHRRRTLDA